MRWLPLSLLAVLVYAAGVYGAATPEPAAQTLGTAPATSVAAPTPPPVPLATPTAAPAPASAPVPDAAVLAPVPETKAADLVPPDPGADVAGFMKLIAGAAKAGDWKLAVVLGLVLLVWLTRKFGSKIPGPFGKALASDVGGVVIAFLWAFVGTLAAALSLKMTLDLHLIGEALLLAFTAMGGWVAVKKVIPASWRAKVPWLFGAADPAKP